MIQKYDVDDSTFSGYLALPKKSIESGVLVFHAWWGLNNFIIKTCDMLAQSGFVTLAPDYYDGKTAKTIEEAKALRKNLDRKTANKLVPMAADFLISHSKSLQIGAIGFSLGAGFAIEAARRRNKVVQAVVLFYGSGGGNFDKTTASFMGHFAENDEWGAHSKKINALADRIRAAKQSVKFYTYPNTKHWFVETDRPEYDQNVAKISWERTIAFLIDELT
jgi:carboxymethylenebutenolidase